MSERSEQSDPVWMEEFSTFDSYGWPFDDGGTAFDDVNFTDVGDIAVSRSFSPDELMILTTGQGRAIGHSERLGDWGVVKLAVAKLRTLSKEYGAVTGRLKLKTGTVRIRFLTNKYGDSWKLSPES